MNDYSIAIRTLGKAGEKYKKLLASIQGSKHQPAKVIVVLPYGYEPPEERLGYEQFVYCPKSMMGQRLEALKYIDSEYTLFLDDDIEFGPDFVDLLLEPLNDDLFDCATGPLFSFFPASTAGKIVGTLTASVSVSLFHRDMYVKILRSGGWSYHTFDTAQHRFYPTDSFAWTCFLIRTDVMRALRLEEEIGWIERFGYAYGDDQAMACKLKRLGYRACVVSDALYIHNDARTSTAASQLPNATQTKAKAFFHLVFWHRLIQNMERSLVMRFWNAFCIRYWAVTMLGYHALKAVIAKEYTNLNAFRQGLYAADAYLKSDEYDHLPPVRKQ